MLVVSILAIKGGVGKSTTSFSLAVAANQQGLRAALVDIDPQATAATWADRREADTPAVISAQAPRLKPVLDAAQSAGAKVAFIDTAPHASEAALAAARAADLVVIPCQPSVADLDAVHPAIEIARLAGKPTLGLITRALVRSRLIDEAREAITAHGIACAPVVLHQRLDHVHALTHGLTAQEYAPRGRGGGGDRGALAVDPIRRRTCTLAKIALGHGEPSQARRARPSPPIDIGDRHARGRSRAPTEPAERTEEPTRQVTRNQVPSSREGKRAVVGYVPHTMWRELRIITIDEGTSMQGLVLEALEDLLRKRGRTGGSPSPLPNGSGSAPRETLPATGPRKRTR